MGVERRAPGAVPGYAPLAALQISRLDIVTVTGVKPFHHHVLGSRIGNTGSPYTRTTATQAPAGHRPARGTTRALLPAAVCGAGHNPREDQIAGRRAPAAVHHRR